MLKKLTPFFVVFLCIFSLNLNAQVDNFEDYFFKVNGVDSIIGETYDTTTKKMVLEMLEKYTYNAQCKPTKTVEKNWDLVGKKWVDNAQALFTYDAQNRLTNILNQAWKSTVWKDSTRINFAYSGTVAEALSQTTQEYLGTTWTNSELKEFTYTTTKKVATETRKIWSGTSWVNVKRTTNTYDAQNRISVILEEDWASTKWVNRSRDTYTYNAQSKLQSVKSEDWDATTNSWMSSGLFNFAIATNSRKVSFDLNFFGLSFKVEYLGSATGFLDTANIYISSILVSRTRFVYNPACQTSPTQDLVFLNNAIMVSPNPTQNALTIRMNDVVGESFSATLFNASGIAVDAFQWKGKGDQQRDVSRLPNGLYFLSVKGEKWQAIQKFVVQQ
jgi:hypothetical protein